jgi:hypothetical protein
MRRSVVSAAIFGLSSRCSFMIAPFEARTGHSPTRPHDHLTGEPALLQAASSEPRSLGPGLRSPHELR